MSGRRRNGKPASCEPCRRDKVRCDHAQPVCSRCKDRRGGTGCFYHPAPLTRPKKPRSHNVEDAPLDRPSWERDLHRNEVPVTPHIRMVPNDHISSLHTAAPNRPILSGYFGPMSFVSPLTDAGDLAPDGRNIEATRDVLPSYWVQKIIETLLILRDFPIIEAPVREYYNLSQSAVIPAPFIINSLGPLEAMLKDFTGKNPEQSIKALTTRIIHNTAETFEIPSSITGSEFHTLYTGTAIRLEIIGVICCLAGRAAYLGLAYSGSGKYASPHHFGKVMLAASNDAIHICKMLAPANDLTIWNLYENLLLSDMVHGDSSPHSWGRLGDISTDLFALGYHRDAKGSGNVHEIPEFVMEVRRRHFCAAYQFDKGLATFLGRPPRISKRYTDSKIPLDLSDEALATNHTDLSHARAGLDEDGWSNHRPFQRATWIRVRYIVTTFRDEVLEVSMQRVTPENRKILHDISRRSHEAWESLPAHIRQRGRISQDGKLLSGWLMAVVCYLAYLYTEFIIQRLLAGKTNPRGSEALLSVSVEVLSTALNVGTFREQSVDLRPDFTWVLLLYGFPSASLLIKALQHNKRTGEPLLYDGSRAQLIRHLSVFISHLETIVSPDNANYALFQRTSQIFTKIIDEVLEPEPYVSSTIPSDESYMDIDRMIETDGLDLFNSIDFGAATTQWMF